jgi:hypothetical protein
MCAYFLVILGKGTADACLLVTTSWRHSVGHM